ncbi:hypothetical protein ACFX19_033188 [Malus domestica]
MNEAIARLTRTVEEKDLQIATLVSRLEPQDGKNPNPEDESTVKRIDVKPEPDQVAALMGSLSIQQLQEMITNTIKYLRVVLEAVFKEDRRLKDADGLSTAKVHAI